MHTLDPFTALSSGQLAVTTGGFSVTQLARAGWQGASVGAAGGASVGGSVGDAIGRRLGGAVSALVYPTPTTMANGASAGGTLGRWTGAGVGGVVGGAGGLVAGTTRDAYQQLTSR